MCTCMYMYPYAGLGSARWTYEASNHHFFSLFHFGQSWYLYMNESLDLGGKV